MGKMGGKRAAFACALALAGIGASAPAGANLIADGGFEEPIAPNGSYFNYSGGQSFGPNGVWTVTGGTMSVIGPNISCCGGTFPPGEGLQQVDLTGPGGNNGVAISQSFATTAGHAYALSFMVGNISGLLNSTTSTVLVYLNGGALPLFTAVNATPTPNNVQAWQTFATSFVATGATTTISFANGDAYPDDHNGLDNIVVEGVSGAVPEPATWALLIAGFGGIGASLRRRGRALALA